MFQLKTEARLRAWREFRSSLNNMSLPDAMSATAELWSHTPFTPYYLDIRTPEVWPDPWQLMEENVYCDVAKSLGIVYTLLLSKHRNDISAELRVYRDTDKNEYNLSWFNEGKYILNLTDREVVNIEQFDKNFQLVQLYSAPQLQLEKY